LLSAIIVFVASSILHMVLTYHRSDYGRVPAEDQVMEAFRKFGIAPGDYLIPCAGSPKMMKDPSFIEKMKAGPIVVMTVIKGGSTSMGTNLALWFLYTIAISLFAAYITGRALGPGAEYLDVFRFAGCTAFLGYSAALWQNSIWFKRSWKITLKSTFDGLVYSLLTAGTFGWLWPR